MNRPIDADLDDRPNVKAMSREQLERNLVTMSRQFAEERTENRSLKKGLLAAGRLRKSQYHPWANSGGPNECRHGRAEGIPCLQCDEATVDAALDGIAPE